MTTTPPLELRRPFAAIDDAISLRTAGLIAKTNQFTLTTRSITARIPVLFVWSDKPRACMTLGSAKRFGAYGLCRPDRPLRTVGTDRAHL